MAVRLLELSALPMEGIYAVMARCHAEVNADEPYLSAFSMDRPLGTPTGPGQMGQARVHPPAAA
jgi:hypothetical protein